MNGAGFSVKTKIYVKIVFIPEKHVFTFEIILMALAGFQ
jgi:hypothetical protein